jgi:hypothetical protein
MLDRYRWLAIALCVTAGPIADAAAYAPPQMKLRELDVSDRPVGPWIDLGGASLRSANGYELGVVLEKSGQHVLVELTALPEGATAADQNQVYDLCFAHTGTPGEVVDLDQHIRYAGNGTYGVRMTVSDSSDASSACKTANPASAEGSFSVDAQTTIRRLGRKPLVKNTLARRPKFGGFAIDPPKLSGFPQLVCALNAVRQPDGSLRGDVTKVFPGGKDPRVKGEDYVADLEDLPRPGVWSCAARQDKGGGLVRPPWSEPSEPELVREVWYGLERPAVPPKASHGPVFKVVSELEPYMAGARVTYRIRRSRCGKKLRTVATARSRVDRRGVVTFRFRLPRLGRHEKEAVYLPQSSISDTKLIVPGAEREPPLLMIQKGRKRTLGGSQSSCS